MIIKDTRYKRQGYKQFVSYHRHWAGSRPKAGEFVSLYLFTLFIAQFYGPAGTLRHSEVPPPARDIAPKS